MCLRMSDVLLMRLVVARVRVALRMNVPYVLMCACTKCAHMVATRVTCSLTGETSLSRASSEMSFGVRMSDLRKFLTKDLICAL